MGTEFSTRLTRRLVLHRIMVSNSHRWRLISIICVFLAPLVNVVGYNFDELNRSTFQMIAQPLVILTLVGVSLFLVSMAAFRFNRFFGNFIYLCLVPTAYLFFNFAAFYEALVVLNEGIWASRIARLILLATLVLIIFMAIFFHKKQWWFKIVSMSAIGCFILSCVTLVFNGLPSIQFGAQNGIAVDRKDSSPSIKTLPNVYYIISDGLTGPINYQRLTGEPLDYLYSNFQEKGFISIKHARSNYLGSASSIGSVFHLEYFRNEHSDFTSPAPDQYFPAVAFKKGTSKTTAKLQSMGMDVKFSGSWYSGCQEGGIKCLDNDAFNLNRLSLRLIDNSLARYLSTGTLGVFFPLALRRNVDAISPVTRFLSNTPEVQPNQFIFVHHMQPHDPWYYDEKCRHIVTRGIIRTELYRKSVRCIKQTLDDLLQTIERKDPDAIVVLQGDHGWLRLDDAKNRPEYTWDDDTLFYRTEITNLVKLPKRCHQWVEDELGPMNTMRLILACLERRPPSFSEEVVFVPDYNYGRTGRLKRRLPATVPNHNEK